MWLNDLADACRKSGLTVHEVGGWRSNNHGQMTSVRGVVCHHTGSSGSGAEGVVRNGRAGLAGPLAQLTLRRDGSVGVLANGQAWHAGTGSWPSIGRNNGNAHCIGIEAIYNGSDITDAQRRAYPRLVAALCRHYKVAVGNVIGHREWAPGRKIDPGKIDMAAFRREVAGFLSRGEVLRLGSRGPAVRTLKDRLKNAYRSYAGHLVVDEVFDQATETVVREFQRRSGLAVDGVVGPATRAALKL
jgi:N-acetyl-anhydromuramyl-L-alanine amidase AmpD